jgi:hypothetical protein
MKLSALAMVGGLLSVCPAAQADCTLAFAPKEIRQAVQKHYRYSAKHDAVPPGDPLAIPAHPLPLAPPGVEDSADPLCATAPCPAPCPQACTSVPALAARKKCWLLRAGAICGKMDCQRLLA